MIVKKADFKVTDDISYAINLLKAVGKLSPGEYTLYISNKKPTRTTSQNKYLWAVVYKTIADETGNSVNDIHELMKQTYGGKKEVTVDLFFNVIVPKSTTDYDTKEMTDYIESIRQWSLDFLNCRIPEANEVPDDYLIK